MVATVTEAVLRGETTMINTVRPHTLRAIDGGFELTVQSGERSSRTTIESDLEIAVVKLLGDWLGRS